MTERIDHAAKARYWLPQKGDGITPNHVAVAQVHATLALVEQQRIANLIALAPPMRILGEGDTEVSVPVFVVTASDGALRRVELKPDIAAALGIKEEAV